MSYTGTFLDKYENEYPKEHITPSCKNCALYNPAYEEFEEDCPGDDKICDDWRYRE
jgi:hypothetical protein